MPEDRDDLRALSVRLVALHATLLKCERRAWEHMRGPTNPAELLRLLLNDPHFAWLRPLSGIIARIDEALDPLDPREALDTGGALDPRERTAAPREPTADANSLFQAAHTLLRSGGGGEFQTKYREALQKSPEVVMAHADVVKILTRHGA